MDRIEDILDDMMMGQVLWFPMPGTVQSFSASSGRVSIQLDATIEGATTIAEEVPVIFPGGGDWSLTFHPAPGDRMLLVFCSREIYLWLNGQDSQSELIRPEIRTAVAFPVLPRSTAATSGTSDGITLRKRDNSVSLTLSDSGLTAKGDLDVTGSISATGRISANLEVTALAITPATSVSLSTHTHPSDGSPPTPGS